MKKLFCILILIFNGIANAQPDFEEFKNLSNSLQVELFAPEKITDVFRVGIKKGSNEKDVLVNSDAGQGVIVYLNVFYKDNPDDDYFSFSLHKTIKPEYAQKLTSQKNSFIMDLNALTDYIVGRLDQKFSDSIDKIDYIEISLALPHLTEVFSDNGIYCFTNKVKLSSKLVGEMLTARSANGETAPDTESSQTDAEKTE